MKRVKDFFNLLNIFLTFSVMAAIGYYNITYALILIAGMAVGVFVTLGLLKAGFLNVGVNQVKTEYWEDEEA